ncbi:MAG: AAA family ATPase [Planctomycetota bacterium]|nr:AAA family ATPase [Planctomycetota bacterium]
MIHSLKVRNFKSFSFQRARAWQTTFLAGESTDEFANRQEKFRARVGDQLVFNFRGAHGVPAPLASEGTLLTVGLMTILLGPKRPRTLLLDDLGQALHPRAQVQTVELLRELMKEFNDLQILATAHSPYLLDCLSHDEVRIVTLDAQGGTVIGRLIDHPQFEKWKNEMAPGELWSLYGEKWFAEAITVP